jgi:integrase
MAVPRDLKDAVGKREIKKSLPGCTPKAAKALCRKLGILLSDLWHRMRIGGVWEGDDYGYLVEEVLREALEERCPPGTKVVQTSGTNSSEEPQEASYASEIASLIAKIFQENNINLKPNSVTFGAPCARFGQILSSGNTRGEINRRSYIEGEEAQGGEEIGQEENAGGEQEKEKGTKLSVLLQEYEQEKMRLGSWTEKTRRSNIPMISQFVQMVHDPRVEELNKEMVRQFRQDIMRLPKNFNKMPQYSNKSIEGILAMEIPEKDLMEVQTLRNRFNKINSFLIWVREQGHALSNNLLRILTLKRTKSPRQERAVFTPEDLGKLFRNETFYALEEKRPERYWVPLIALYSGARLEEICQLEVRDITKVGDIWCFDINDRGDKTVKTDAGKRLIPLHPQLISLGLLEYWETMERQGEKRLFPNLKKTPSTNYSHHLSTWFTQYRKECGVGIEKGEKKTFHSFRHTFLLACKESGMPHEMAAQIVGHETSHKDMTYGRYGDRYSLGVVYGRMVKLRIYGG